MAERALEERPPLRTVIALNVYRRRKELGWSQEKLGRATELSRETIRNLEAGRAGGDEDFYVGTVERVATALSVEPSWLVTWDPSYTPSKLAGQRRHLRSVPHTGEALPVPR